MPIDPADLYALCEKEVIILPGDAPLGRALWELAQSDFNEATAWLVVQLADGSYRVSTFTALVPLLQSGDDEILYDTLEMLPLPAADRVIPTDTAETVAEIQAWLEENFLATVVIVDGDTCAGLFTNSMHAPKRFSPRFSNSSIVWINEKWQWRTAGNSTDPPCHRRPPRSPWTFSPM